MYNQQPRELTDEEYRKLYAQEAKRRESLGLRGPPFVRKKPTLLHPQNPDYKRWLENNLELNG